MNPDSVDLAGEVRRLEARLHLLERSRRRQSWALGGVLLLLVVVLLGRGLGDGSVRAQRFVVVDAEGVERGSFGIQRQGQAVGDTMLRAPRAALRLHGSASDSHSDLWVDPDGLFLLGGGAQMHVASAGISLSSQKGALALGTTGAGPGLSFSTGLHGPGPGVRFGLFESTRQEFVPRAGALRGGDVQTTRSVDPVLTFYGASPDDVLWQVRGSAITQRP